VSAHVFAATSVGLSIGFGSAWLVASATGKRWVAETIARLTNRHTKVPFAAVTVASLDWRRNQLHQDAVTYFMKPLFRDQSCGLAVTLIRYPAGQINPAHSHPIGHGMYVLQGSLVTHRGTFGPNTFVWFPSGEVMTHGAGDDEDLLMLFVASDAVRTDYVQAAPDPDLHTHPHPQAK
jgi:quercetin dioxygenase-like cupin family protein